MAGFSNQQDNSSMNPFLLDLVYLQNHPMAMKMIMPGFMEDHGSNMALNTSCFSQFYPPESTEPKVEGTVPATIVHESSCVDHSSKVALSDDNEPSVTKQQSSESSTVVDKLESGEQVTQKLITPIDKKRKARNGSSPNSAQSKEAGEEKGKKQKQCIGEAKVKQQQKPKAGKKKTDQEAPSGYIHVRARRGQATDSHSLAERVRREKISERMKVLQKLVPGCDRVTGKALMLDEIINYVQSLQDQVEFLSMKLASANPMFYDFAMDQDSFIFRPSERLYFQTSPVPQCSPNQATVFADTQPPATTTTTAPNNSYTLMDTSASISLHGQSQSQSQSQSQRPSTFSQDNATLLWDVEEQGQKFLNPSGFNDNLCSFN